MTLVFVYGSLKRGYALHQLLEAQTFAGEASTLPLYHIFDIGRYPGLVEWPDGIAIQGEVYQVNADCLAVLDDAEGVSEGCYARRSIRLQSPFDQDPVHAWFWLHPITGLRDCGPRWP